MLSKNSQTTWRANSTRWIFSTRNGCISYSNFAVKFKSSIRYLILVACCRIAATFSCCSAFSVLFVSKLLEYPNTIDSGVRISCEIPLIQFARAISRCCNVIATLFNFVLISANSPCSTNCVFFPADISSIPVKIGLMDFSTLRLLWTNKINTITIFSRKRETNPKISILMLANVL